MNGNPRGVALAHLLAQVARKGDDHVHSTGFAFPFSDISDRSTGSLSPGGALNHKVRMHHLDTDSIVGIDRPNRIRLVESIRRYMAGQATALASDDEIFHIREASEDSTVQWTVMSLWFHYDDLSDHLANLSPEEWDYFHRLILILESSAFIEVVRHREWSMK